MKPTPNIIELLRSLTTNPVKYYQNNFLNLQEGFAHQQGLTQQEFDELQLKYFRLAQLIQTIDFCDDLNETKSLLGTLKELEFEIQSAWKFPQDSSYHYYEFLLGKCSCHYGINYAYGRKGIALRMFSPHCQLHKELEKDANELGLTEIL